MNIPGDLTYGGSPNDYTAPLHRACEEPVMRYVLLLLSAFELLGFGLTSYGLVRQSFAEMSRPRGFDRGTFQSDAFDVSASPLEEMLVAIGRFCRLIPAEGEASTGNVGENAALTVLGLMFIFAALVMNIVLRFVGGSP
jgi:hypothetical protein